jgi:hypothetical protein
MPLKGQKAIQEKKPKGQTREKTRAAYARAI